MRLNLLWSSIMSREHIKKYFALIILFYFPALFSLICNLKAGFSWAFPDFIEKFLTTSCILIICFGILNNKVRLFIQIISYIFITLIALIEVTYYSMYKTIINMSAIYILIESNSAEISEYLQAYFRNIYLIVAFLAFPLIVVIPLLIKWNKPVSPKLIPGRLTKMLCALAAVIVIASLILFTSLRKYNLPCITLNSFLHYRLQMKRYNDYKYNPLGGKFSEIVHDYSNQELYVLVIGESVNRDHLSLYGYRRDTNPELKKIIDELFVYKDVICPFANTISSLTMALTYGNYENPNARYDGTITQLFNHAGFKTYWLSNQEPLGLNETFVTKIAKSCTYSNFQNAINNQLKSTHDEILLKPLKNILAYKAAKKFVIIHLLGSHVRYSERCPKDYEKFTGKPETKYPSENAYKTINAYDNSILYTDFILSKIIEMVKSENRRSFVLYLSDHGEDVFESSDKAFHAVDFRSRYMYEIPFILWTSEQFRKTSSSLIFDPERPFMTDDLFYGLSDLAGIRHKEFQDRRSLFNKNYAPRKRFILNGVDYDLEIKNK